MNIIYHEIIDDETIIIFADDTSNPDAKILEVITARPTKEKGIWCLDGLYVKPEYRGYGVESELMDQALKAVKEKQITLRLETDSHDDMICEQPEEFYLGHGFQKQDGPHPYYEYKAEHPKPIKPTDIHKAQPEIISEINRQMGKNHGQYLYEYAILDHELPLRDRNEIARQYVEEGWKYVYHRTTSENSQRPGLTVFYFSIAPINTLCNIHCVTKNETLHVDDSHQIDQRF